MRLSYACGHELLVHGLDEDGAATAVQTGAICDFNLLHLAMRSCRQQQEHLLSSPSALGGANKALRGAPCAVTARPPPPLCNLCHVRELEILDSSSTMRVVRWGTPRARSRRARRLRGIALLAQPPAARSHDGLPPPPDHVAVRPSGR